MPSTISPNMSLIIPTVGQEPGPDYALDVNASLTLIDQHDHTPGNGVQITPAGLDINDDLDMQDNSLLDISNAMFISQGQTGILRSLYVAPGFEVSPIDDLWFTDGDGNEIQITSGGAVNATVGSIPGESYAGGTFFWKQGAGSTQAANFDIGHITIRPNTPGSTFGVVVNPPTVISSEYDIFLPLVPLSTKIMQINSVGEILSTLGVDNTTIEISSNNLQVKDNSITAAKLTADSVTTAKIVDLNVTTAKIDDLAVTTAKINALAVTRPKISNDYYALADSTVGSGTGNVAVNMGTITVSGGRPVVICAYAGDITLTSGAGGAQLRVERVLAGSPTTLDTILNTGASGNTYNFDFGHDAGVTIGTNTFSTYIFVDSAPAANTYTYRFFIQNAGNHQATSVKSLVMEL